MIKIIFWRYDRRVDHDQESWSSLVKVFEDHLGEPRARDRRALRRRMVLARNVGDPGLATTSGAARVPKCCGSRAGSEVL